MGVTRQRAQRILRDVGLLKFANEVRYFTSVAQYYRKGLRFRKSNPTFKLPPNVLAFDAYSAPDWDFYKRSGKETALFLASVARRSERHGPALRVYEWGCGPARVIRHIGEAFGAGTEVFGSDYNPETIRWCTQNLPGIEFSLNGLQPPLDVQTGYFDFIYSISVFTHLSEQVGTSWMEELVRVMKTGAVAVITTNGDSRLQHLLPDEAENYKTKGVAVRASFEEGKKLFMAYHSPEWIRNNFFQNLEILEFAPGSFPYTAQDMWVVRKP